MTTHDPDQVGTGRAETPPQRPTPAALLRALLVATGVGVPVALAALGFLALTDALQTALWETLPDQLDVSPSAWWWVVVIPTVGGVLSGLVVLKLPGRGGHEPIKGFSPDPVLPSAIPGVALAALASLSFGAVLGPEAPLLALGSALGLWFARLGRLSGTVAPLAAAAGLFAAISTLFGNPLPAALLVVEVIGMGGRGAPLVAVVLPGMLSAAAGYLVISGVGSWTGVEVSGFTILDLPDYPTVRVGDLLWAILLAVALATVVHGVRWLAQVSHTLTVKTPYLWAPGAGLLVGAMAAIFAGVTGQSAHLVLFSGESTAATVAASGVAWGSGTLVLLLLLKALAYAVSLGSLFRGGPVFPALFLGVAAGVLLSVLVPSVSLTASVVAGMAAATSAALRLPLSAVLLAVLLGGSTAVEATTLALIASAVSFVAAKVLDRSGADRAHGDAEPA